MDLGVLEARIDEGEDLQITYQYPTNEQDSESCAVYRTRTDKLLAVEPSSGRVFVEFEGRLPVWIESHEIDKIESPT